MKLGQVAVHVTDLPNAVAFYRDILRLPLLFEFPNLAFFDMGGVRLMLSAEPSSEPQEAVLYYKVDDLDKTWREMRDRSATAEKEPHLIAKMPDHDLWMAFLRDPEGRLVGLMSEVRR